MTIRFALATVLLVASANLAMAQPAPEQKQAVPPRPMMQQPAQPGGMGMKPTGMPARHPMMGAGMMPMMHPGMMGCEAMGLMPVDRIEGRIAFLKTEIGITDAQAPKWDAFANALRAQAKGMQAAMADRTAAGQPQSAPDRTEAMITHMTARLDSMKNILAVEKPLYAALSDEQKKTADELLLHPGMGMGMGPGMMGGRP
ncbi:MAG TPA: hypothetical protein DDZ81_23990 [Acetobacteraceae bacterium]|jgi:hypothetical protein|nr:hypothetical protein [Acetobacteraceae bacterium]